MCSRGPRFCEWRFAGVSQLCNVGIDRREFVRADRVLAWAIEAPSAPQRRNRLLTVRRFALAMQAEEPRHEAPAADSLGRSRFERKPPFIYTP